MVSTHTVKPCELRERARDEVTRLLRLFNDLRIRGRAPSKEDLPPAVCADRLRLSNELRSTMDHIVGLNNQIAGALLTGDLEGLQALEEQVQNARKRKDALLAQFKAHLAQHRC